MNPMIDFASDKKVKEETMIRKRNKFLKNNSPRNSWSKYESKCEDLKKTFDTVSDSEKLIYDCICALQKEILHQGRLYICLNGFYFHAHVFRKDILVEVKWKDVLSLKRSKTAKLIPNAILIKTNNDPIFFTSFGSRDKTFILMHRLFQCVTEQIDMSESEVDHWIHFYNRDSTEGSSNPQTRKLFRNKVRNQLKLLQQHVSNDLVQEVNYSKEKQDDRGHSESNCTSSGFNLLNVPPSSFEALNFDTESNDGGEVFGDESRGAPTKPRTPSPFSKFKKNGLFPLKKTRSRSFEQLEKHDKEGENVVKLKEAGEDGDARRRGSLQVPRQPTEAGSEESEQDSDSMCHCGGHEELPKTVLDNIFQVDVDDLFKKMFQKSHFWSKLLELNNAKKDVVLSPWAAETDGSGARVRNISYTLSLDIPCGPKHSSTSEKQVLHADSNPGEFYLVDSECVNDGLPYGKDFYIANRYCISKISEDSCRLRITSQIKYKRNVFGIVKSFIDKNATAGIMETFGIMGRLLKQEANQLDETPSVVEPVNIPSRKKVLRKRIIENPFKIPDRMPLDENQNNSSISGPISATINQSSAVVSQFIDSVRKRHNQRWIYSITFAQAVQIVTILALVLCLFNIFLYFKMSSLQAVTTQFETMIRQERASHDFDAFRSMARSLDTAGDIRRWKETMSSLLVTMEDVLNSMSRLGKIVAPRLSEAEDRS